MSSDKPDPERDPASMVDWKAAQPAKSPHERAMDWHEAALEALTGVQQRAAEMIRFAEREVGKSLAELVRYEKTPGVALPVAEQQRVEAALVLARRRMEEHEAELRGEECSGANDGTCPRHPEVGGEDR